MKNYKLCYIQDNFAYFTTQELEKQTGDDWNDAPYEHNAGLPYLPHVRHYADGRTEKIPEYWNEDGTPKWEIYTVAYSDVYAETPAQIAGLNSRCSVDMINAKVVPWLTDWPNGKRALFAGASVEEFIEFIESQGGTVYLPKEKNNGTS